MEIIYGGLILLGMLFSYGKGQETKVIYIDKQGVRQEQTVYPPILVVEDDFGVEVRTGLDKRGKHYPLTPYRDNFGDHAARVVEIYEREQRQQQENPK